MIQRRKRVILIGVFLTFLLCLLGCGNEDKYVAMVKTGNLQIEPNIEVGKAFDEFFVHPKWESFESDDHKRVVEFNGDCTWDDKPAKCTIQFVINNDTEFEVVYVAINDVSINLEDGMEIVRKALTNKD